MDSFIYYENVISFHAPCLSSVHTSSLEFPFWWYYILVNISKKAHLDAFFFSSSSDITWLTIFLKLNSYNCLYKKICDAKVMKVVLYFCHWLTVSKNFWFKSHWWLIDWAFIVYLFKSWNKNWCFFYLDWLLGE